MPYQLIYTMEFKEELSRLRKPDAVKVADACKQYLIHEPKKERKSRIKRLREGTEPEYRLRVDDFRVFYDVDDAGVRVIIKGVTEKGKALGWLMDYQSGQKGFDDENTAT